MMELRTLGPDDAPVLRAVWLRALADAPTAFGATLADQQAQPDTYWTKLVQSLVDAPDQHVIIAYYAQQPCGLIHGSQDHAQPDVAHVGAVWVDPAVRGQGLGRTLLDDVAAWARERGVRRLELWVTEENETAIRHYERAGFRHTGRRDTLPSNHVLHICHMARDL